MNQAEQVATPRHVDGVRVERVVTSGTFSLDGETFDVDNNVWLVGTDAEVVVVDAAHDAEAIAAAVGDRTVSAIICTHGHDDHIDAVEALRERVGAPAFIHPDDTMLWNATVGSPADGELSDKQVFAVVDDCPLIVLHTPGHTPGACCLHAPELEVVFTGDTLFQGGPGATGRSFSSRPQIEESIRRRLFRLPDDTVVLTGHGDSTTIAAERAASDGWTAES